MTRKPILYTKKIAGGVSNVETSITCFREVIGYKVVIINRKLSESQKGTQGRKRVEDMHSKHTIKTLGGFGMSKTTTGEVTEIRALRESYGITVTELCKELGMKNGHYSVHELGYRSYKDEKYEQFYYNVSNALERIRKRRLEESYKINVRTVIVKNQGVEEEEEELVYQPITQTIFNKALHLSAIGKDVVWIAVKLEICELQLEKRFEKHFEKNLGELDSVGSGELALG